MLPGKRTLFWAWAISFIWAFVSEQGEVNAYPPQEQVSRPNIIVLLADDLRADKIAELGEPWLQTPNFDRLVWRGTAMSRVYLQGARQAATCVTSRAMLLTGCSLFRVDEQLNGQSIWPRAFAQAGYSTFATGKWHNGEASLAGGFQQGRGIFAGGMTDPFTAKLSDLADGRLGASRVSERHSCEVFADEAISFLRQEHRSPFFCYVAFNAPHDPHIVPKDFPVHYDSRQIPLPENFAPQHPFDNGEMKIRDEQLLTWPRGKTDVQEMLAEYARHVSYLDSQVGRILKALEDSPFAANTLVVLTSDSGVAVGSHGLIGKQNLYEHSVKVPLVIAGPGIRADRRSSAICYHYDLFPTLGDLCGVQPPKTSEGQSFRTSLIDPDRSGRSELFLAYRNLQRAYSDGRWKLIHYPQVGRTQLFELPADPQECNDLAGDPRQSDRIEHLMTKLRQLQAQFDDPDPPVVWPNQ